MSGVLGCRRLSRRRGHELWGVSRCRIGCPGSVSTRGATRRGPHALPFRAPSGPRRSRPGSSASLHGDQHAGRRGCVAFTRRGAGVPMKSPLRVGLVAAGGGSARCQAVAGSFGCGHGFAPVSAIWAPFADPEPGSARATGRGPGLHRRARVDLIRQACDTINGFADPEQFVTGVAISLQPGGLASGDVCNARPRARP